MAAPTTTSDAGAASGAGAVRVTVIIKALNEAKHIDAAISSALAAIARVGGEVILADSGSTDRTVEIAARHPITVVQLRHRAERRCGIGPQLGYQNARGEFIYILDGDMELEATEIKIGADGTLTIKAAAIKISGPTTIDGALTVHGEIKAV